MKNVRSNKLLLLWYSYPRLGILLALIAINIAVIFIFTAILALVSGNSFIKELAYIFTYTMCSDGIYDFVNSREDLACFIIKILLTVIQMIIFSGALIGFSTDILQSTIDKRLNNVGKIALKDHYVFLNWSSIGAQVVYDLSFLESKKNIVILCENDRDKVLESIQNIFLENNRKMKNIRVFVKQGNPNSIKHLKDVSIEKAQHIGVLMETKCFEENDNILSTVDLNALKTLLNIISLAPVANIVIETLNASAVSKIEKLLSSIDKNTANKVTVFSHNGVLGNILGKTVMNSHFNEIYHHLLSYDGCEFYGIPPMEIDEALVKYNDCIPIINYDDDDEIDANGQANIDQLYILSDNAKSLGERKERQDFIVPISFKNKVKIEDFTLFTFSNDDEANLVETEIKNYNEVEKTNIVMRRYTYEDDIDEIIKIVKGTEGKKKILLLSSEKEEGNSQDTEIFLTAMTLKLGGCIEDIEILAEITNPTNLTALQNFGVMSVIVSNKIISLFMVQLLTHPQSRKFYRDIISTNGSKNEKDVIDIDIIKASEVINMEKEMVFKCKSELVQS
ncbi:MAG: hypothetical protein J6R44_05210, partial [Clostridia bacterium]|nr:hypothetical protein [Clostridia bacterium]